MRSNGLFSLSRRTAGAALIIFSSFVFMPLNAGDIPTLAIGSPAPDFSLPGVDGKTHSLKDFASAKILLIAFTSNHCPEAQAYEDRLIAIASDYKDKSVAVVAINPNSPKGLRLDELGYTDLGDTFEEMKIRAEFKKFNFPYLDDGEKEEVSKAYGPRVTPHYFVFDSERKLRYCGRLDDNNREEYVTIRDLRNALDDLLAGKEVKVKTTPTNGCSTKWATKEDNVKAWMDKIAKEPVEIAAIGADELKALRQNESGKIRLVDFWDTTCAPCMLELPELVTINRMYRGRRFEFIAIATNKPDEKDDVLDVCKRFQMSNKNYVFGDVDTYKMKAAFDPDWSAANPYTVLIGAKGEILYKANKPVEPLELKRAIVKALKELNRGVVMDVNKKK